MVQCLNGQYRKMKTKQALRGRDRRVGGPGLQGVERRVPSRGVDSDALHTTKTKRSETGAASDFGTERVGSEAMYPDESLWAKPLILAKQRKTAQNLINPR
jgi:hypothetical protein